MRALATIGKWVFVLLVAAILGLAGWLAMAPPDLIRVGSAYTAKIVCSNVFIANRHPDEVLAVDVQAPGHPLLKLMRLDVDREGKMVTAGLFGLFGNSTAAARDGLGCTSMPDDNAGGMAAHVMAPPTPLASPDALWPQGNRVDPSQDPRLAAILDDPSLTGEGMRAVVVVRGGRIVGERYAEGFSAETPLLGWSMTKSVNAAIIGTLVKAGKVAVDKKALFGTWTDARAAIGIADLMAMSSGLEFNEDYGDVTDVTRMLFLEPDMAAFAAAKPSVAEAGTHFSYSSGTSVMLSRLWQDAIGDDAAARQWPSQALFSPLGMTSAVFEMDEKGTFVGSSYLYATGRDWARFGQFLLQDGIWNGNQILPAGFVAWMREAAPASNGVYTRGQLWIAGPGNEANPADDAALGVPSDTFWLEGHDGQTVAVVPSKDLVVVRMGLTPSKLGYRPQNLLAALSRAL